VAAIVHAVLGDAASDDVCAALVAASGGNPFYLSELLRALAEAPRRPQGVDPANVTAAAREGIASLVVTRSRAAGPGALRLAQVVAVLGDGCERRQAAVAASVDPIEAMRLAAALVGREVLADDDPPRFIHPVVRDAIDASLGSEQRDGCHRA